MTKRKTERKPAKRAKKAKSVEGSTTSKRKSPSQIATLARDLAGVLQKAFPDHSVVYDDPVAALKYKLISTFSTGLSNLDAILAIDANGYSGMPYGRQIEISGPESSGKTNLVLLLAKMIAAQGGLVHYYEMENVLDLNYAYRFVPEEQFIISQPDSVEDVFDSIFNTLDIYDQHRQKGYTYPLGIFWDTVSASAAEQELDKDMDYTPHGLHSVKIGQGERKLVRKIAGLPIVLVWTSQIRHNIQMGGMRMKKTRSAVGEVPLGHYAALRLRCSSIQDLVSGEDKAKFGRLIKIKTTKNKTGGVVGEWVDLRLLNQAGFCSEFSMLEALQDLQLAQVVGRTCTLNIPGVPEFKFVLSAKLTELRDILYENPGLREQIISEIRESQRLTNTFPGFKVIIGCLLNL